MAVNFRNETENAARQSTMGSLDADWVPEDPPPLDG